MNQRSSCADNLENPQSDLFTVGTLKGRALRQQFKRGILRGVASSVELMYLRMPILVGTMFIGFLCGLTLTARLFGAQSPASVQLAKVYMHLGYCLSLIFMGGFATLFALDRMAQSRKCLFISIGILMALSLSDGLLVPGARTICKIPAPALSTKTVSPAPSTEVLPTLDEVLNMPTSAGKVGYGTVK